MSTGITYGSGIKGDSVCRVTVALWYELLLQQRDQKIVSIHLCCNTDPRVTSVYIVAGTQDRHIDGLVRCPSLTLEREENVKWP